MTVRKHVVLVHDTETERVGQSILDQSLLQLNVLENPARSSHAQSGTVQVDISKGPPEILYIQNNYIICF